MAEANPLRYRGYYYDRETGFYYLNSRYYDPKTGRFINADSYVSTGQGIVGYNMFAYCGNNPVNREDAEGRFWDTFFDIFSLGFSIYDVFSNPTDGWAWAGLGGDLIDLIPFVTGVGEGTKALGVANKVDNVHDAAKGGRATELVQYGDSLGKMGIYIEHPNIKVDWSQYAGHGLERLQQRGMTQEMVDQIVANGKVLSQNNDSTFAFITQFGVAVVDKNGKLITTWSGEFYDNTMREIVKKLFGE